MKKKAILLLSMLLLLAALPQWTDGIARADVKPTKVELSRSNAVIDMAESTRLRLSADVLPEGASQRIKWSTSNSSVAKVSSDGVVTARKRGTVTITATAYKTKVVAKCTVKVINSNIPDSISIGGSSAITLLRFEERQLTATVKPATANQDVRWKSSKSSVVQVSSDGVITARKKGTATITCYSAKDGDVLDTVKVTVRQQDTPKSISVSPDETQVLVVGETLQLKGKQSPSSACGFFEWRTSSSKRASVSEDGLVKAKATGWVTITCRSRQSSKVSDSVKILVVSASSPHSINLGKKEITIHPGETYQLDPEVLPAGKDQRVRYSTSRSSVARVSDDGLITARKKGTATITVKSRANSDVQAQITVKVENLPAPTKLSINASSSVVEKGGELKLTVTPSPAKSSAEVKWKSSDTSVARVSDSGVVTGRKGGKVTITATSSRNSKVKATYTVTVNDPKSPTSIKVEPSVATIEVGQKIDLEQTVLPANASQGVKWSTSKSSVAKVDSSGVVTGRKTGSAVITAYSTYNSSIGGSAMITVVNRAAPTSLSASYGSSDGLSIGQTAQITVTPKPSSASRLVKYASSNRSVVTVSETGLMTAKKAGTATITITSGKKSSVKTTLKVTVYDATTPRSISLSNTLLYLGEDDRATLKPTILPANAAQGVTFKSSNTAVASVNSQGVVTAGKSGTATIICTTQKGGLTATCTVHVLDTTLATVIPERTTKVEGIAANLAKIEAIRKSAANQVLTLARAGKITNAEANARVAIIDRAFEMQAFPWMTKKVQEYWSSAYAYKRYLPDTVYYGLPYIQTGPSKNYLNRRYNAEKALDEKRYTATGKGYYLLNQDKLVDKMYCGNDCSSFVSMSQFGTNHAASYLNTTGIATSKYYRTISGYDKLKPGDLLVKSGDHTVLFLYYVDAAKTKMMIIEQGGNGSTVICSIFNSSWFSSRGYVPRRQISFNAN